ncbi:MAG: ribosomal protein S18-alanine N-acetyltransferase [Candidatus Dadabacteria bacterium]|nr:ribosomal protein S18-alanine N-acetyltransferase [Candidatus Dadabacteria bacterium]NIS07783.1 ribosomal protein S18-alanine N-acetyltransferase [Candidatus Dadabacteria bacterium]NIY21405.1 ribosomal protein S18-alanine N-acetyltransferase [Candidatus Dadabacteria bacterium]
MSGDSSYKIEPMHEDHIPQIMEIEKLSFPTPWHKKIFELEIGKPRTLNSVYKMGEKVVGYLISWMLYDEIHILNVAVHPDFRRNGIAKKLIDYTIERFKSKGAVTVILEVRTSNIAAQNLYEKMGFQVLRTRKKYYSDTGEDALVMMLDLDTLCEAQR